MYAEYHVEGVGHRSSAREVVPSLPPWEAVGEYCGDIREICGVASRVGRRAARDKLL